MPKLSVADFAALKQQRQKIAMITAYDAPSARFADAAGVDAILVGDSAAMTVFGYEQTTTITLDDMMLLARAAPRAHCWSPTCLSAPCRCPTPIPLRTPSASSRKPAWTR